MKKCVLITGANRGIGLALTEQYASSGYYVYAICRQASEELKRIAQVNVIEGIDVTDDAHIKQLKDAIAGVTLELVINNAGVLTQESLGEINYSAVERQFLVNALGPLKVTEALQLSLVEGSKVALISSRMGSVSDNGSGGSYGYRMSKSALNAAGKSLAIDMQAKGVAVGLFHPGFVQTELVNNAGYVTASQAAEQLITRIAQLDLASSGIFRHANGEVLPW